MPEGHCHAESCFARLVRDGLAYDGSAAAFWALTRFAEACWAVMAELPPPVPPCLRKPTRRGRKSAFRYRPRAMSAPKPRWLSRADLNN
ncbi:MAG: hypothetical protein NVV72_01150 [Asticcacaulis sp.]|nr:hypothetical protein [Asticcacaulis sp.]